MSSRSYPNYNSYLMAPPSAPPLFSFFLFVDHKYTYTHKNTPPLSLTLSVYRLIMMT